MIKNHQNNAYSLVDEHTTTYENPFKFSAKELDDITGLYDHGARSRNPMSTLWYGVDPLWEQYPDFSPYNYCAGNPVKLVDPDGRAVYGRKNEDGTMSYIIGENENITAEGYEWIDDSYDCMDENGNYKTLPNAKSTTTMSSTSQSQPTILLKEVVCTKEESSRTDKISDVTSDMYNFICDKANDAVNYLSILYDIDAISLYGSASAALGTNFNVSIEVGYVKGDGFFVSGSWGFGTGFDLSIAGELKFSSYSGNATSTIDSYGGEGSQLSFGYGFMDVGYSFSEDYSWKSINIGASVGSVVGGSFSYTNTKILYK